MADPPRYPDTSDDADVGPDRGSPSRTPSWVNVFKIVIVIILLLLIVVLHITGTLGPGLH